MAEHRFFEYDASEASPYAHIRATPGLQIVDRIDDLLLEVYKMRYPDPDDRPLDIEAFREQELGGRIPEAYGTWVYYPWRHTLVHLLPEEEFIRLRTVRNLYKITGAEREKLRQARVGVIGLSVGHSVSMALAMERIAGEIRIADFDTLELGNMNRIRTGVHNLGVPKTTIVAREIAEIDPFLKVTCFDGGIDKGNIDRFFDEGGRLDVLVEECDSVEVKILARQAAKARRVPVVMDTSDRLMIDIERFDLDPGYPIMHGMVDETLDYDFLRSLNTSKDKLPYILPFAGIDQISDRMAASALELGTSISSWPQLATEVQIGGALAAHYVKEILLGIGSDSIGRIYHDWKTTSSTHEFQPFEHYRISRKDDLKRTNNQSSYSPKRDIKIENIIQESMVTPSAANLQNWKFYIQNQTITITLERKYQNTIFDIHDLYSLVGLGCLIKSIEIICTKYGYFANSVFNQSNNTIDIKLLEHTGNVDDRYDLLFRRFTKRGPLNSETANKIDLDDLAQNTKFTNLHLLQTDLSIYKIEEFIGEFDRLRLLLNKTRDELFNIELNTGIYHQLKIKSGLYTENLELSKTDEIGIEFARRGQSVSLLNEEDKGGAFRKLSRGKGHESGHFCVLTGDFSNKDSILTFGKFVMEFWIECTRLNISLHPITSPIPIIQNIKRGNIRKIYSDVDWDHFLLLEKEIHALCNTHCPDIGFIARMHHGLIANQRIRESFISKIQYL